MLLRAVLWQPVLGLYRACLVFVSSCAYAYAYVYAHVYPYIDIYALYPGLYLYVFL